MNLDEVDMLEKIECSYAESKAYRWYMKVVIAHAPWQHTRTWPVAEPISAAELKVSVTWFVYITFIATSL